MPKYVNSLDKIVFSYLAAVTKENFSYNGQIVQAKPLTVSPLIFRGFSCPGLCGGCCPRFSLEYLPTELRPDSHIQKYQVEFRGKQFEMFHDPQGDHFDHYCRHLDRTSGRCGIYSRRPFHCDFELIRVFVSKKTNRISQQLFGRKWQLLRIDNKRGALCKMENCSPASMDEVIRKLKRLKEWADYFQIPTWLDEIIVWVASGPHAKPLQLVTPSQINDSIQIKAQHD